MEKAEILNLYNTFSKTFDIDGENKIWDYNSATFRNFWNNRIIDSNAVDLNDEEIDQIVRILDRSAKGNKEAVGPINAVARIMVPQGAWRRLFREIKGNNTLKFLLNNIFNETNEENLIQQLDELYKINKDSKNYLTGRSGNAINALMFAYNPTKYISVVSLDDRKKIIDYFGFSGPNFDRDTQGKKIVTSNKAIIDGFKFIGIDDTPRIIASFLYLGPLSSEWKPEIGKMKIRGKEINVSIPDTAAETINSKKPIEQEESKSIQAKLAEIGETLGFNIWIPIADRGRVLEYWKPKKGTLLEELPIGGLDETTLKTIKNIDVLWIQNRRIVRAFEVEHTTSIISGILRMADLLALQPNITVKVYIVAPDEREEEVITHIIRPAFSDISGRKLSDICLYLSYSNIINIANEKNLKNMKENIIDEYAQSAQPLESDM